MLSIELVQDIGQVSATGFRRVLLQVSVQVSILSAIGIALVPTEIYLPFFVSSLSLVAERMSLLQAVVGLAVLGRVRPAAWQRAALSVLAGVFFIFLYLDHRELNRVEDHVETAVTTRPEGAH